MRARAALLATLLVASVVAGAVPAGAFDAGGPPGGMVAIDSSNVEDIRAIDGNISEADLEGAIYTSDHAATTEVSIVTEEQAQVVAQGAGPSAVANERVCSTPAGDQSAAIDCQTEMSLVISDDQHHEGRQIALRADVIRAALGEVPSSVTIANNETGEEWTYSLDVEDGWVVANINHFSSNSVTWAGEVNIQGNPATDGTQYQYNLTDTDSVDNYTIDVTGRDSTETESVSASGLSNGDTLALDVAGNDPATSASVTFTGEGFNRWNNFTGTAAPADSSSINSDGNLNPEGPSSNNTPVLEVSVPSASTHNPVYDLGSGGGDRLIAFGDDINDATYDSEVKVEPNEDGKITKLKPEIKEVSGSDYGVTVDVYIHSNGVDGTYGDGTLVKSDWDPSWSTGTQTINLDSAYEVTGGTEYTIEFVMSGSDGDGTSDWLALVSDTSPSTTWSSSIGNKYEEYGSVDVVVEDYANDLSVSAPSGESASFGSLSAGQSATAELALSNTDDSLDWSATSGTHWNWTLKKRDRAASEDPAIDIDGDGVNDASYSGLLEDGSTSTHSLSNLSVGEGPATISLSSGNVTTEVSYTEHTISENITVEVNGNSTSYSTRLSPGDSTSLTTDTAWVQSSTNYVNVSVAPGLSADAPTPAVGLDYSHEASDTQSVDYSAEKWTERYNISHTYSSARDNASVTIPFESSVIEMRSLETRTNGGTWSSVSSADYSLDNTTLTVNLGTVSEGDTVEVRANGTLADVNNGSISVVDPTTTGNRLDSKININDWSSDSYISVPNRGDSWHRVHYAYKESYSSADDSVRIQADGPQHLRLPNAVSGASMRVSTIPVEANPVNGDVVVEVEEPKTTEPEFVVSPGSSSSDDVGFTYVAASDGDDYILYSYTQGVVRDSGTASSPLTLEDDDSEETLAFLLDDSDSDPTSGGGSSALGPVGPASGSSPLNSLPVVLAVWSLLLAGIWYVDRRVGGSSGSVTIPVVGTTIPLPGAGGLFWTAAPLSTIVLLEFVSGGALTESLGAAIRTVAAAGQDVVPALALIGGLTAAYFVYKRYIKGSDTEIVVQGRRK